jgi:hypothetical protein
VVALVALAALAAVVEGKQLDQLAQLQLPTVVAQVQEAPVLLDHMAVESITVEELQPHTQLEQGHQRALVQDLFSESALLVSSAAHGSTAHTSTRILTLMVSTTEQRTPTRRSQLTACVSNTPRVDATTTMTRLISPASLATETQATSTSLSFVSLM